MRRSLLGFLIAAFALHGCATAPLVYEPSTRLAAGDRAEMDRQLIVTIREAESAFAAPLPNRRSMPYGSATGYQPSPYARRIADQLASEYGLDWVAEWRIDVLGVHCVVFRARDVSARAEAIRRLADDARVESVQPMQRFTTSTRPVERLPTYNDPYFGLQKHVEALYVAEAHRWSRGRRVRVAVIDTGVDLTHPELEGRIGAARNFVDDDRAAFLRDAHGTAVAGVIAAAANNGLGIIGVAPEVELLALKACWHENGSGTAVCNTLTLAEALAFAIERRAAVINLSLTGPADPLLTRLVATALSRGVIVVGADAGPMRGDTAFPNAVPGVLAVADADVVEAVRARIAAPGHEILTLTPSGRYDYLSGASLSSAMVSGIVALLLEQKRDLSPAQIAGLLERTAQRYAASTRVVNACGALASVVSAVRCDAARQVARHSTASATGR